MGKSDPKSETRTEAARIARAPSKTSSATSGRPARRPASAKTEAPYHHGALREALLQAAERVLERDGLAGLTLRAVAREAGVSHAAPTHHFGDLTGLLSELAAVGFRQFNAAMASACDTATTPLARALARPKAYVAYAQAHPGMYGIMFRTERLDYSRPSLHEAAEASFAGLANAIGAMRQEQISGDALTLDQGAAIARAWSMVHGFTTLLLDGRLKDILERLPEGTTAERLLEVMLTAPITAKLPT
ncbi:MULTISPECIES: TetR/AcrR family transcriptional regulator [Bradyrhizobium]|jgi:AcrR family transcriptional regulator|uniref:Transcriptional regulatory protein n=2 Tax=Bradyrhizobium diazoefficiens TaxID=1355477 RepID=Q89I50_BRADU|nr:TetR-like C-terminal domain-containing protein [Bradyrhizobium diazoefficiens]AND90948.1 transcriptional regulator [Bradyrhizobium diazoefficiens USDA 110]QBP24562.1 TetR/AcrR family transcriptional regulator [Bradyrhizobium diazoefficiens]QLD42468.1 WHG domain-containing protein [Bradyrhizobium diazoefficiens]WLA54098.1 WHG domain-containing protein [Bradyrhizobium diazoefficiens]WLB35964.1 WHG domain-containing protein [Bradyrhizobium diazoefficiens]